MSGPVQEFGLLRWLRNILLLLSWERILVQSNQQSQPASFSYVRGSSVANYFRVPPNCSFLIDDCDNDWVFREQFDFIHTRAMVAAIKDWPRLFEQAYA